VNPLHRFLRLTGILTLLACLSPIGFAADQAAPAPNSATPGEKTAIDAFKTSVEDVGKWIEEKEKTVAGYPAAGIAMAGDMIARFKGIRTDGLPSDLKAAWGEMGVLLGEMGEIIKNTPKFDGAKPEELGQVRQAILPEMMAVQDKVEPVAKKLQELGAKYGVDMKRFAPGGKSLPAS
jgi:hypothetical protein